MTDTNRQRTAGSVRVDQGFECAACGNRWYYTRPRCAACGDDAARTYDLPPGELVAVTEVHATPPDVRSPNALGLARFGDVQLIAQLDGNLAPGDRVAFAGTHRLREGDDATAPRLTPLGDAPVSAESTESAEGAGD